MVRCPQCGHQNLPSFPSCSKCGTALGAGGGPGFAGPPARDDYQQLMAKRAAASKRNKMLLLGIAIVGVGFAAVRIAQEHKRKGAAQAKLDYVERFIEAEKRETGAFWNCVMAGQVDIGMFANASQIQQKIESAYFTQMKTFSDYLVTECVPKVERARQAFGSMHKDAPAEFVGPVNEYQASLPKLQAGIEDYAEKIKNRQTVKDVDQLIQEHGNAWHSSPETPTPEGIAFEKFMHCAVPGLAKMKDAQALLEFMADQCFKKDPVKFMDRVRSECGPILEKVDPAAKPSGTWKLSAKTLFEDEARQLSAWESCGKKSRKGKKVEDLEVFLVALGDYMKARAEIAKTAREIQEAK